MPTVPYLVVQRSPGEPSGVEPTNFLLRGMMIAFEWMFWANSSVRAKRTELSFGLIVIPVQANAGEEAVRIARKRTASWGRLVADAESGRQGVQVLVKYSGGTTSVSQTPLLER